MRIVPNASIPPSPSGRFLPSFENTRYRTRNWARRKFRKTRRHADETSIIKQKQRKKKHSRRSLSGGAISRRLSKRTVHPIFVSIARVRDKLISCHARMSHALANAQTQHTLRWCSEDRILSMRFNSNYSAGQDGQIVTNARETYRDRLIIISGASELKFFDIKYTRSTGNSGSGLLGHERD